MVKGVTKRAVKVAAMVANAAPGAAYPQAL